MTLVPTVDLSTWADGDRAKLAHAVDEALTRVGFLQVIGHGIPQATIDDMREATASFFALPVQEKLRSAPADRASDRGYAAEGTEGLAYSLGETTPPDLSESFVIGAEHIDGEDPYGFFAPNIWPGLPESLRPALTEYEAEAHRVARVLLEIFEQALGLPGGYLGAYTKHPTRTLRVNHFERRAGAPEPLPGQMRLGAHTDYGIVTVLYADPVPGLQIHGPDGAWHDVVPDEGALVVNLGDLTAQWTNDRWRSTLHRVVPPSGPGPARRRSVAFFFDGDHDARFECLPTCQSPENPPKYPPVLGGEHLYAKITGGRTLEPADAMNTAADRN
ncbi:isopenicillin N synthase family dioxygenase [Amycolatopsis azurea]|uniref:Oxidoreductase n=1 Tax=Amycolatopsis azurea DSM 43854 TaxID=1238180 RepID=M2QT81_9PSEU|nr:2-oxoglutarate and iron-dependent oxygenase domain-containing protein [Amycolatopsis azurea]EMD29716.1 putative Oxidoreductase, 2OG-Fe(II) oxygenase family [Amycolatopsis azurea DSM 43854]OOC07473.1 oxidoreductase [Amycolatopsis azurea DSM 43854]